MWVWDGEAPSPTGTSSPSAARAERPEPVMTPDGAGGASEILRMVRVEVVHAEGATFMCVSRSRREMPGSCAVVVRSGGLLIVRRGHSGHDTPVRPDRRGARKEHGVAHTTQNRKHDRNRAPREQCVPTERTIASAHSQTLCQVRTDPA